MASLANHTLFEPLITGPLLWAITRGPPTLRAGILVALSKLPFEIETETVIKSLKWLVALGLVRKVNNLLNAWALNNWHIGSAGGKPWVWGQEIAVITGGSGGIGSLVAQKLASKGMKVAIMDLQPPPASLKYYTNIHFYECDITNPKSVTEVASAIKKDLGNPTILCNNAGIGRTFTILDVPNEYLEKIMHINLISHWYTVKEFLPGMIAAKKGHILTTASMASHCSVAGMVDYCVTKAGAMSFSHGLQQELKYRYKAPFIKTTAIHPYWVRTALLGEWEQSLTSIGVPLMTPEYVADRIAKAIFAGKSSVLVLPDWFWIAPIMRSIPWLHMLLNDSTKDMTIAVKK